MKAIMREYSRDYRVYKLIKDKYRLGVVYKDIRDHQFSYTSYITSFIYGYNLIKAPMYILS